jgi:3-isopropylmalate/(R)-2-methylmalate dehydratase small subunit
VEDKQMTKIIKGIAAPFPLANVDTDVIMPKRFLITITREGLADGTFADLRFDNVGQQRSEFILNNAPWTQATILVVGDNFGCGSSREHAVWGMRQLKINACMGQVFPGYFTTMLAKMVLHCQLLPPRRGTHFYNFLAMPTVLRYRLILVAERS